MGFAVADATQIYTFRALLTFPLCALLRSFSRIEGLVGGASEDQRGYAGESSRAEAHGITTHPLPHCAKEKPRFWNTPLDGDLTIVLNTRGARFAEVT
jgi:hypothetical protein